MGAYSVGLYQPPEQRDTAHGAGSKTGPTNKAAGITAPRASNLAGVTYTQTYYDREDLNAQRDMARWTRYMGQAAIIGIVLSIAGIWLIWRTWEETRKAAVAGHDANKIARETNRAWVTVDVREAGPLNLSGDIAAVAVKVIAKNVGNSVALNVRTHAYICTYDPASYGDDEVLQRTTWGGHGSQFSSHIFPNRDLTRLTQAMGISMSAYIEKFKKAFNNNEPDGVPLFLVAVAQYRLMSDAPKDALRETEAIREICVGGRNRFALNSGIHVIKLEISNLGSGRIT